MRDSLRKLYLLYHELRPGGSAYSYVLDTKVFEEHASLLARLGSGAGGILPEVTFDDGHISNFEFAAPILQSHGLTAWFFITAGWTGARSGYMGWSELRTLHDAGQSIGAHGWSHKLLTHCDDKELQTELIDARIALEDKLGVPVTAMSLPGGRYNRRVLSACQAAGYTQVFTSIPRAEEIPPGSLIGRFNIRRDTTSKYLSDILQRDSRILDRLNRQYKLKSISKRLLGDGLYERVWAALNRREASEEERDGPVAE